MRELDPFAQYAVVESAIPGFGGPERSDDPSYALHTHYIDVNPGKAAFHIALKEVCATVGELTLRVHGLRTDGHAELVTSATIPLDELSETLVERELAFMAISGTSYALYGFFSVASDATMGSVSASISENAERPAPDQYESRRSAHDSAVRNRSARKLVAHVLPTLKHATSQPYSRGQVVGVEVSEAWPESCALPPDPREKWKLLHPFVVLSNARLLVPGARGVVVNAPARALVAAIESTGCLVDDVRWPCDEHGGAAGQGGAGFYDFAIGYDPEPKLLATIEHPFLDHLMNRLAENGWAVLVADFPAAPEPGLVRNIMQQIALRLIGRKHDVAQLSMTPTDRWTHVEDGQSFAIVARY